MDIQDFESISNIVTGIVGLIVGFFGGSYYVYKKNTKIIRKEKSNSFWSLFSFGNKINQNTGSDVDQRIDD